VEGVSLT